MPPHRWRRRERPLRLERRLGFPSYAETQVFVEQAGELSEATGIYPNLSFGPTYASLTLFADETSDTITPAIEDYARRLDALVEPAADSNEEQLPR